MTDWTPFVAVAGVLTLSLLVFARQSQQLLEAPDESGDVTATVPVEERAPPPSENRERTRTMLGEDEDSRDEAEPATQERRTESVATGQQPPSHEDGSSVAGSDQRERTDASERATRSESGTPSSPRQVELTPRMLLANVAFTQGGVLALIAGAGWYFAIPAAAFGLTGGPWHSGGPAVAVGVVFGLALWVGNEFATTVADAAGAAYDESVRRLLAPESGQGWIVLFAGVLPIIAISEELLFRAALIGVPASGFGLSPWVLAVGASMAFALGHGAQGRVGIVVTGVLGFVLAAGYVLSGSLLVVIVAHYVVNATEFAVHEYAEVDGPFESLVPDGT